MEVDIYDFDRTLVPMDSGSRFYFFCLPRYPQILLLAPLHLLLILLFALRLISLSSFKRYVFCFIRLIPLKRAVERFWDRYEKKVYPWFSERRRFCVVISASPDFLLEEIARRLHFDALLCTVHDRRTGKMLGENCCGEEKVRRFKQDFPSAEVINVYSDSVRRDRPLFALGRRRFLVTGGRPEEFDLDRAFRHKGKERGR